MSLHSILTCLLSFEFRERRVLFGQFRLGEQLSLIGSACGHLRAAASASGLEDCRGHVARVSILFHSVRLSQYLSSSLHSCLFVRMLIEMTIVAILSKTALTPPPVFLCSDTTGRCEWNTYHSSNSSGASPSIPPESLSPLPGGFLNLLSL